MIIKKYKIKNPKMKNLFFYVQVFMIYFLTSKQYKAI